MSERITLTQFLTALRVNGVDKITLSLKGTEAVVQMIHEPAEPAPALREAMADVQAEREPRAPRAPDFWDTVKSQIQSPTPPPAFDLEGGDDFEVEE